MSFTGRRSRDDTPEFTRRCTSARCEQLIATRSRFAIVFEMAISRRRSRAVGWRLAMIDENRCRFPPRWLDARLDRKDVRRQLRIELRQRVNRASDLRLDHAAHLEHTGGNAAQLASNWVER